jgi:hypothetical protein
MRVGTAFDRVSPQQLVQQAVSVYGDAATAEQAYRFGVAGMDCSEGTVGGKPVVLTRPRTCASTSARRRPAGASAARASTSS